MTELEALCCYYASAAKTIDEILEGPRPISKEDRTTLRCNGDYMDDALIRIRELAEPRIPEWLEYGKTKAKD